MNRSYRLIWNRARQCWNVTSELTRSRGKCGARAARVLGASLLLGVGGAQAGLPEGGTVVAGSGSISQSGNTLLVEQQSQRLVTEWQAFSIGQGHRVEFRQPGADAAALARVLGPEVSVIQGALSANGQLFLVNPNGVLFAPGAEVNVGSLVASTLAISTDDFMAGNDIFAGDSSGLVINRGNIRAADGGLVALIAAQVENVGTIDVAGGTVALAAGSRVRVDMGGPIKVEVEAGAIDALVTQGGAIRAEGGRVYLTARAARDLASSAINHGGMTMVSSLRSAGGVVRLEADQVSLGAGSVVDASGGAQGGKIDVLGDHLVMAQDALLDVSGDAGGGEILFGGNYLGLGPERNASTVSIAPGASLRADARVRGDGGRVIVWSDDRTEYAGFISARGGPNGGDGGFVETSSKRDLIVTGRVTTAAPMGQAGAWLLDPEDVVIDSETGDKETASSESDAPETADSETTSSEAGSFISAESVSEALAEGSGVTVYSTGSITASESLSEAVESGQLTLLSANDAVAADTLPGGGTVVRGDASISSGDLTLTVDQSSQAAAINWSSFSIGRDARVRFNQPSASAATLNRVLGNDPSHIYGRIDAVGRVYLVNPRGVLFGESAQVNVGAMVASTLDIDPDQWMDGARGFAGDSVARVFNEGQINVGVVGDAEPQTDVLIEDATPAYLTLIGREIDNRGVLSATEGGTIDLVAGQGVNLDIGADTVTVTVEEPATDTRITHSGEISTAGGTVRLQADAVALEQDAVIDVSGAAGGGTVLVGGDYQGNNPEVLNAWTTTIHVGASIVADALDQGDGGRIIIWADDTTRFAGAVSARGGSNGGDGGFIEVSGKRILDFRGTADTSAPQGRTGMLLLDPTNITIANTSDSATDDPDTGDSVRWLTEVDGVIANHRETLIDPDVAEEFSFLAVSTLEAALGQTHITVTSECAIADCEGWITVGDKIQWDSGNTLSLHATGRIFINADIDARGADGVTGGSVVVRSGFEADGSTPTTLTNGIFINDASILTGGGASIGGDGLDGGEVILQARDGAVVFTGDALIDTSGSAAAAPGDHAGGSAGNLTILAGGDEGVGIHLDEYALIAEAGASTGNGASAARGDIVLSATTGTISQDSDGQLLGASLVATTTTGDINLYAPDNDVALFAAASTSGSIWYNNGETPLIIDTIGDVVGVSTGDDGEIVVAAGSLRVNQNITTEAGDLVLFGGTVDDDLDDQFEGDFIGIDIAEGVRVTTEGGDILLAGRGGDDENGSQYGIRLNPGALVETGGGNVPVIKTSSLENGPTWQTFVDNRYRLAEGVIDSSTSTAIVDGLSLDTIDESSGRLTFSYVLNGVDLTFLAVNDRVLLEYDIIVTDNNGEESTIGLSAQIRDSDALGLERIFVNFFDNESNFVAGGSFESARTDRESVDLTVSGTLEFNDLFKEKGTITAVGRGGTTTGSDNHGIVMVGDGTSGNTRLFGQSGSVSVTATGGGDSSSQSANNRGLWMTDGAVISAGGAAEVDVEGEGGRGSGGGHQGILIDGAKDGVATADHTFISTNGGELEITATGGRDGAGSDALALLNHGSLGTDAAVSLTLPNSAGTLDLSSGRNRDVFLELRVRESGSVVFGDAFASDTSGFGASVYAGSGDLRLTSNTLTVAGLNPRLFVTGGLQVGRRSGGFDTPFSLQRFVDDFDFNASTGVMGLNGVESLRIIGGGADVNLDASGLVISGAVRASGENVTVSETVTTQGGSIRLDAENGVNIQEDLITRGLDAASSSNDNGGDSGNVTINAGDGGVLFNKATVDTRGGAGAGTGNAGSTGNLTVTTTGIGAIDQSNTASAFKAGSASFTTNQGNIELRGGNSLVGLSARSVAAVAADRGDVTFVNSTPGDLNFDGELQGKTVVITHVGNLTQSSSTGSITAETLALNVTGVTSDVTLNGSNSIDTLAASIEGTGGLSLATDSLTIGSGGGLTGITIQNGALSLTGLSTLQINQQISAVGADGGVHIIAANNRSIDLGAADVTDAATRLSLTQTEFQRINATSLTLKTSGTGAVYNTDTVVASGALARIEIDSAGDIIQSAGKTFGFGNRNDGELILTSANGSIWGGLDESTPPEPVAMTLRGASKLTLSGPKHLFVHLRNSAGNGAITLSKLHINSSSQGRDYAYGVTGASNLTTFELEGTGSITDLTLTSGHQYTLELTSTGGIDFLFDGNSHVELDTIDLGTSSFEIIASHGINAKETITSTSGNITLRGNSAGGLFAQTPKEGRFHGVLLNRPVTSSAGGNIVIEGTGGGHPDGGYGIYSLPVTSTPDPDDNTKPDIITRGGDISTTGNGTITLTGVASGFNATARFNSGILIFGAEIKSASGAISLTGSTDRANGRGIQLVNAPVITTGSGSVSLHGTSTGGEANATGVHLEGTSTITTGNAAVHVTGLASGADGAASYGIHLAGGDIHAGSGDITLIANREILSDNHRAAILQSSGILKTTGGLKLVSQRGDINLGLDNDVARLAADMEDGQTLFFDNGGRTGVTTIGTVDGLSGVKTSGSGGLFFSDITELVIDEAVLNESGDIYFRVDTLTVNARVGNSDTVEIEDLDGIVSISGRSNQADLSAKPISLGDVRQATDLHITDAFMQQFNTREFRPRTAGVVTITSDVTLTTIRDRLSILGETGIATTGNHALILPNSDNAGRIILDATGAVRENVSSGSVGSSVNAITTKGASSLFIATGGDFNVVAQSSVGGGINLETLGIWAGRASSTTPEIYNVSAANLETFDMQLGSTGYTLEFKSTTPIDFRLGTAAALEINKLETGPSGTGQLTIGFDFAGESTRLINDGAVVVDTNTAIERLVIRSSGSFTLDTGNTLEATTGGVLIITAGDIDIETGASLLAAGNITLYSGEGDSNTFTNKGVVTAGHGGETVADGFLEIWADNIDFAGSSLNADRVLLRTRSGGRAISVAGSTSESGRLDILDSDLNALKNVTDLTIGQIGSDGTNYSGSINISAALNLTVRPSSLPAVTALTLATRSGHTTQSSGALITVENLRAHHHAGSIRLNEANQVTVFAARAETGADVAAVEEVKDEFGVVTTPAEPAKATVEFTNAASFTVGNVLGTRGVNTTGWNQDIDSGTVVLTATSGNIILAENISTSGASGNTRRIGRDITITANNGAVTVNEGVKLLAVGGNAFTSASAGVRGGDITLTASGVLTIHDGAEIRSDGSSGGGIFARTSGGNAGEIVLTGSSLVINAATLSSQGGNAALAQPTNASAPTNGGDGGDIVLDATSGSITLAGAMLITLGGDASQSGTGVNLNRGTMGIGGEVVFSDPVVVGISTVVDEDDGDPLPTRITTGNTGRQGNTISFVGLSGDGDLVLNAGTNFVVNDGPTSDTPQKQDTRDIDGGDITFKSAVGLTGNLTIETAADVEFKGLVGSDATPAGDIRIERVTDLTTNGVHARSFVQVEDLSKGVTTSNSGSFGGATGTLDFSTTGSLGLSIANNEIDFATGAFKAAGGGSIRFYSQTEDLTIGNTSFTISGNGGLEFRAAETVIIPADPDTETPETSRPGTITISRGSFITSGGQVVMHSPTLLNNNVSVTTAGGDVTFASTLDSTGSDRSLTINAGTGNVEFGGLVGNTRQLSILTITDAGNVTANGIRVGTFVQTSGSGTTTFNNGTFTDDPDPVVAALDVGASSALTVRSGSIVVNGALLIADPGNAVTLEALGTNGLVDIAAGGSINVSGAILLKATDQILVGGSLDSTGSTVTLDAGGDITVSGNIDAKTALTVTSTSGNITLNGGLTSQDATVQAVANNNLTITGSVTADGSLTLTATAGDLTQSGNVTSTGSFVTLTGGDGIALGGNITTTNQAITLNNAVTLTAAASLTSSGGSIALLSTVVGDSAWSRNLSIDAGAGTITLGGSIGGATDAESVGHLTLTSSAVLAINHTIRADRLTINDVSGVGDTRLNTESVVTRTMQTYNNPVLLTTDVVLESRGTGASGAISFDGEIVSDAGQSRNLTINTAGVTRFGGSVGGGSNGHNANLGNLVTALGGTVEIDGGSVHTTGEQTYSGRVILGNNTTLDGVDLTFGGGVRSDATARALTILDTGTTRFDGAVGDGARSLTTLTVINSSTTGEMIFNGAEVITTGAQTYNVAQLLLDDDLLLRSTASGQIDLNGKFNSIFCEINALTVETQGLTVFHDRVGMFRPLGSITTDGLPVDDNRVEFKTDRIATLGSQNYGEMVTLNPGGSGEIQFISRDRGTIQFGGPLDATGAGPGVHAEIITSGSTVFDGAVGATAPLASLTTSQGGSVAVNGGSITTSGAQNFLETAGMTLGDDTVFLSTANNPIVFAGPIGSAGSAAYDLSVVTSGLITFGGVLGVVTGAGGNGLLGDIETNGGGTVLFNTGVIQSTGTQDWDSFVQLAVATVFTSTGAGVNGDIHFRRTIDTAPGATTASSLTVNTAGETRFGGAIGANSQLASIETDASGTVVIAAGQITTTGAQTFNDAAVLLANTTLTSTDGGNIGFGNTLDGGFDLVVNTGGDTIFGGVVGGGAALASVFTDGPGRILINGGGVTTTGQQSWNDAVLLGAHAVLTSTGLGQIRFDSTVDGAFALTVNTSGATIFNDVIGGETALASLETDAGGSVALDGGAVTTTGFQRYNELVTLGADTVLTSEDQGDITFGDTLDSEGVEDTDVAYRLTVNTDGATVFDGKVGDTHALLSVFTDAGGTVEVNDGLVRTVGNQTFSETSGLILPMDTVFISTAGGDMTFAGPIGSQGSNAYDLTVTSAGLITFDGNLGVPTPDGNGLLATILVDGGGTAQFNVADVRTVGSQTYDADVVLADDAVFFSEDAGDIDFQRRIDSDGVTARRLDVNTSGATRFGGLVGSRAALASVETDEGGTVAIDGGGVTTTGFQLYNELATLAAEAVLTSTGAGEIRFVETLDGPGGLIVNTAGETIFDGVVGGTTALASAVTDGPGLVRINGGAVTTTGLQNWNDAAVLGADTVLTSTGNGQVRFGNTVNGAVALVVNTGGATVFDGVIGGNQALSSVFTNAGGTVAINGGAVTTTGAQTYNEIATLGANAVLTSTGGAPIEFGNTLNGGVALQINTAGQTRFGGAVGNTAALTSIATDGPGSVLFAGPLVRTTGAQTFGENALLLGNDVEFLSLGNGAINFGGGPNGARSMTVNTGGAVTFSGIPGGATPLANLTVFAGTLSGRDMVASGNILLDVRDRITLGNVQAGVDLEVRSDRDVLFDGTILVGRNLRSVTGRGGVRGDVTQLSGTIRIGGNAEFVADTVRNQIDDLIDMVVGGRLAFTNANRGSWRPANDFSPIITNNFEVLRRWFLPTNDLSNLPEAALGLIINDINLIGFAIAEVEEIAELTDEGFAELVTLFSEVAQARTQARMVVVGGGVSEVGREVAAPDDAVPGAGSDGADGVDAAADTTDPAASPVDEEDDEELRQSDGDDEAGDLIATSDSTDTNPT